MEHFYVLIVDKTLLYGFRLAWIFPVMTILESLFPVRRQGFTMRLQSLVFWALAVPVAGATMAFADVTFQALGGHALIAPRVWFGWDPVSRAASVVIAPIIGAMVGDFFFYWGHRAQHAFFWRFHRVHHSITELNAVNSYHHISEELFRTVLMVWPNAIIFNPDVGPIFPAVGVVIALSGFYVHSNVRLHLGPLTRVFCDNQFHRIHHSTDPVHFNKNFCAFTTIWDQLFGTAYFPDRDEWPETGLADFAEAKSVRDWIAAPLRATTRAGPDALEPAE